jgi:epoxyqueuosine reductase
MNTQGIAERLQLILGEQGFRSAIVSATHANDLRQTIEDNLRAGQIDEAVYRQYSVYFDEMLTQDNSWARSIIAVAAPRPILEVVFTIEGKRHSTIIPPTYEHSVDKTVTAILDDELKGHGYRVTRASLPQKLLAAHTGLACYGKNNIAYVDGMGSFHRLIAFYTDLPVIHDNWQAPEVLDECTGCNACTKKCPTGAIDPDQFRLHAERCLTFHNESSATFPSWIDESWHHCLVGCMKCQQYCPVNRDFRFWINRFAEFTAEESALLLSGVEQSKMPRNLTAKFADTDLLEDSISLARNLRSVMAESR